MATSKAAQKAAEKRFEERMGKVFGEHTIRRGGDTTPYEVISSGSINLDLALGCGGWIKGRLGELWGPDAVGKSTLALIAMANAQRLYPDQKVGYIDMEQTLDDPWARAHGVDMDETYVVKPDSAEDVADALKEMLMSGLFSMIAVDSIGAMIPEVEKEKDADAAVVAAQAKIVTRMVKIAAVEARKASTHVLMLNQVRANISAYGADTQTGGGFALRHVTTHKVKIRGGAPLKAGKGKDAEVVGHEVAALVERNKVAPPKRSTSFVLFHTPSSLGPIGIDRADEAATLGPRLGLVEQSGAWYTLKHTGERVQGREALMDALREAPAAIEEIRRTALAEIAGDLVPEDELDQATDPTSVPVEDGDDEEFRAAPFKKDS